MNFSPHRLACGVACALLAAAGLVAPSFAESPPPISDSVRLNHVIERLAEHETLRIIAFGSSSTQGIGASSPAASYPSRLQAALTAALPQMQQVIVLNRGVGGEDAEAMARRLPSVIAEHPDLIIWQTGSNDPLEGLPVDRFTQDTVAGIQAIRAAHIDVMLMEPQLCRELDGLPVSIRYRDVLRTIGAAMDVPVIRRYNLMRGWLADGTLTSAQMLAPDGLHMADAGYARLADAVATDILHRAEPPRVALGSPPHH